MARYRLDVCAIFDTEIPPELQKDEVRGFVISNCPQNFNLRSDERCGRIDCFSCWYKALEKGVKKGEEFVHVERLD